jgi:hypothetical protein
LQQPKSIFETEEMFGIVVENGNEVIPELSQGEIDFFKFGIS